ncbi:MAG: DUF3313 domain-containing protein [Betaproteobacteria bacterium]
MSQPDRLQPVPGTTDALRWIDPAVDFRQYNAILVDRIRVRLDPSSSSVDPNELKALTDYFQASLTKALQPPYALVATPGPGVVRVRITLVDLVSTKPEASVVVLLTPYATIPDMMSGAATGRPVGSAPYLGQTGIAVEFVDSASNRVIAEYADTKYGRKYDVNTQSGVDAAVTSGVTNYLNAYQTWAYAQQAFDQWSQRFRQRMDQLTGR